MLSVRTPLISTLPVLTEAMHLLGHRLGWRGQEAIWMLIDHEDLTIHRFGARLLSRCANLMSQFSDLPMDFADATLVAVAESQRAPVVFTLDSHFRVYRARAGRSIRTVP